MLKGLLKEEEKEKGKQLKNKMAIHMYRSIITLNVNGSNALTKGHMVAEWIKNSTHTCAAYKTHLRSKDTHRLKVKEWEKIFHANGKEKRSWGSSTYI